LGMGLYGISAPGIWGHYGFHSAEYTIRARHTLRSGSIIPGNYPGWAAPKDGTYYVHHPILTHQLVTLSLLIGGDWEYTARSAALVASTLCFLLLVAIVRRWWGVWPAALAAWGFVLVP